MKEREQLRTCHPLKQHLVWIEHVTKISMLISSSLPDLLISTSSFKRSMLTWYAICQLFCSLAAFIPYDPECWSSSFVAKLFQVSKAKKTEKTFEDSMLKKLSKVTDLMARLDQFDHGPESSRVRKCLQPIIKYDFLMGLVGGINPSSGSWPWTSLKPNSAISGAWPLLKRRWTWPSLPSTFSALIAWNWKRRRPVRKRVLAELSLT